MDLWAFDSGPLLAGQVQALADKYELPDLVLLAEALELLVVREEGGGGPGAVAHTETTLCPTLEASHLRSLMFSFAVLPSIVSCPFVCFVSL